MECFYNLSVLRPSFAPIMLNYNHLPTAIEALCCARLLITLPLLGHCIAETRGLVPVSAGEIRHLDRLRTVL